MITINKNKIITPDTIALGKKWVLSQGFEPDDLVTMFDMLLTAKESNNLESKPRLLAVYTWLQTVKELAKNGSSDFPSTPFTFKEVVTEV